MSDRERGSTAGVIVALVLGLLFVLGVMCAGAGLFMFGSSSPRPVAVPSPAGVTSMPGSAGAGAPGAAIGTSGFWVDRGVVMRLADGSYNIVLVGNFPGPGRIDKLTIDNVRLTDVPNGECTVQLPPGPPYKSTFDFVVHTRPLPADVDAVTVNLSVELEGRNGALGTFGTSSSTSIRVDLKAPKDGDKGGATKAAPPGEPKVEEKKAQDDKAEEKKAE